MLTGLLWNFWSLIVLLTVIHFGCWYEFIKLMRKIHPRKYLTSSLLGIIYIMLPIVLMFFLHERTIEFFSKDVSNAPCFPVADSGPLRFTLLIFTIAIIWINDTLAYLVGSFLGKTPLSKISPKKTWEGTAGGALLAICIAIIFAKITNLNILLVSTVTATIAFFGTLGDLLESKLKRMAGVKDSGNFMPGHGGFLDRFDSLLIAVPAVWLVIFIYTELMGFSIPSF